jgi:hypothetical protein
MPDIITCCVFLHNLLLGQTSEDVKWLLGVLQVKDWHEESNDEDPNGVVEQAVGNVELGERPWDGQLQQSLRIYHLINIISSVCELIEYVQEIVDCLCCSD